MPAPSLLVVADHDRVALTAGELIANRLRAGRRVAVHLAPGPVERGIRAVLLAHGHDGSLAPTATAPDALGPPAELVVLDAATPPGAALAAREVLVLAAGAPAAPAVRSALDGTLSRHPCATLLCDRAATADVPERAPWDSDRVVIVLGHREPGISAEHVASAHSRARLLHAAAICRREPVRAAILTGWTHTGGLSEAEQMARWWTVPDVPAVLEVAGRNTAENASRSLPLVLALGGIRRVTVVTSAWHVRTPYFFAPYRDHRLEVDLRPSWDLRGVGHLLALELEGLHTMRRGRREAMSAVRILDPSVTASA